MSIKKSSIALRHPVAHRELGTIQIIPLVFGILSYSDMWYIPNQEGDMEIVDWRSRFDAPGMLFANIKVYSDRTSCQLYVTYATGDPLDPISYAPQVLMGEVIDPRTGKRWDPNIAFYSNLAN
jgi:hypothetical protein